MKTRFLLFFLTVWVVTPAFSQPANLKVEGTVINQIDSNMLPLCDVNLLRDGVSVATAVTDIEGHFIMEHLPAGNYTLVITQFGDTMMSICGLRLTDDTRLQMRVQPPSGENNPIFYPLEELSYMTASPSQTEVVWLRPVNIRRVKILLKGQDLFINSPDDPRLWDFNYRPWILGAIPRNGSASEGFLPTLSVSPLNHPMKNEILTYGRRLWYRVATPDDTTACKKK